MALVSLLNSPMDWTVNAAIIALMHLAHEDADARKEVPSLFEARYDNRPSFGGITYANVLAECGRLLPSIPPSLAHKLKDFSEGFVNL